MRESRAAWRRPHAEDMQTEARPSSAAPQDGARALPLARTAPPAAGARPATGSGGRGDQRRGLRLRPFRDRSGESGIASILASSHSAEHHRACNDPHFRKPGGAIAPLARTVRRSAIPRSPHDARNGARSPEHRHLGAAVAELREQHGLSQAEVADRAELRRSHLAAIERGEVDPTFVTLVRIVRAIPAPLAELFELFEERRGGRELTPRCATRCEDGAMSTTASEPRAPRLSAVLRDGERVTPLELFFDLVFVLALTQCTALMAATPTWEGLAQGLLVLGVLWWSWVGYAWLTSVVDPEEGAVRLVMFARDGRASSSPRCACRRRSATEALLFALAYGVVRVAHIVLFLLASRDDPGCAARCSASRSAPRSASACCCSPPRSPTARCRAALWALALALDMGGPLLIDAERLAARAGPLRRAPRR